MAPNWHIRHGTGRNARVEEARMDLVAFDYYGGETLNIDVTIRHPLAKANLEGTQGRRPCEWDTGPIDRLYQCYPHVVSATDQSISSGTCTGYAAAVGCYDKYIRYPHKEQLRVYPAAMEHYGCISFAFDGLLYHFANRASLGSYGRTSNTMQRWKRSLSCLLARTVAHNMEDACGAVRST